MKRRSVQDWRDYFACHPSSDLHRWQVFAPGEHDTPIMVRSTLDGCLTHIVRFATLLPGRKHPTMHAQCGVMVYWSKSTPVAVEDETFACARCVALAERAGEPTFSMIPTSGCEVSEGRRGRGRRGPSTHRAKEQTP